MPRQPRLDAPGALHHVMGRGIERPEIFANDIDRADFLDRVADLCQTRALSVYAWGLLPNQFHLLVRTGGQALSQSMKKLLTGYVVNFNRRHKRYGHLFQNRYKSILCEDDPYLLELTRYIHLNPIRGGVVPGLAALKMYPWTGHAAIMGAGSPAWQETETILAHFGTTRRRAARRYEEFVRAGVAQGRRPELVGGGLIRSLGGWSQVLPLRRRGVKVASDERILGSASSSSDSGPTRHTRSGTRCGWPGRRWPWQRWSGLCAPVNAWRPPISTPGGAPGGCSAKSRCGEWGIRGRRWRGSWASRHRPSIGWPRRRTCHRLGIT